MSTKSSATNKQAFRDHYRNWPTERSLSELAMLLAYQSKHQGGPEATPEDAVSLLSAMTWMDAAAFVQGAIKYFEARDLTVFELKAATMTDRDLYGPAEK